MSKLLTTLSGMTVALSVIAGSSAIAQNQYAMPGYSSNQPSQMSASVGRTGAVAHPSQGRLNQTTMRSNSYFNSSRAPGNNSLGNLGSYIPQLTPSECTDLGGKVIYNKGCSGTLLHCRVGKRAMCIDELDRKRK